MTENKKKADSKKLPQIYVGEEKMSIAQTVKAQVAMLALPTPEKYIMKREGRGGLVLDYVETNYVIGRLNATFIFDWDSEILEQIIDKENNQIAMKVRLTVRFANSKEIKKDAWGGSEIKWIRDKKKMIDLADDLKSAESDGIKKAASMLGVCWDVYSGLTSDGRKKKRKQAAEKDTHEDISDMASPPDKSSEFRNIQIVVEGKKIMVTKFEALDHFKKAKGVLGEKDYYRVLGEHGYEKSIEIPPKQIPKIFAALREKFKHLSIAGEGHDYS